MILPGPGRAQNGDQDQTARGPVTEQESGQASAEGVAGEDEAGEEGAEDEKTVTVVATSGPSPEDLAPIDAESSSIEPSSDASQEDVRSPDSLVETEGLVPGTPTEAELDLWDFDADSFESGSLWDTLTKEEREHLLTFSDSIDVSLLSFSVRIVDSRGQPLQDVRPEHVRLRIGETEVPVAAVDWVGPRSKAAELGKLAEAGEGPEGREALQQLESQQRRGPGRLIVLFVRSSPLAVYIRGQMLTKPHIAALLDKLAPEHWVAVVALDSHLKLALDFTRDRQAVKAVLDRSIRFRGAPVATARSGEPSLARHFDASAGRRAATPERALKLVAQALQCLPGTKDMIYMGWGFGIVDSKEIRKRAEFFPMMREIHDAEATIFTAYASRSLWNPVLRTLAQSTGGAFLSDGSKLTRDLSGLLSGRHVINVKGSDLEAVRGRVRLKLLGRKGQILHAPMRY